MITFEETVSVENNGLQTLALEVLREAMLDTAKGVPAKHLRAAPESMVTLYRGMSFSAKDKAGIARWANLSPGDSVELGRVTSFSTSEQWAGAYAKERAYKVEVIIQGRIRGLSTDGATGLQHREVITSGNFKVKSVTEGRSVSGSLGGHGVDYDLQVVLEPA